MMMIKRGDDASGPGGVGSDYNDDVWNMQEASYTKWKNIFNF